MDGHPIMAGIWLCVIVASSDAASIPAFPGSEGFGANSVGGRGGTVIKVVNLNDSGPGSFREAVTASGPRIVVFEVSGIIDLQSELKISEPYLTIAGQTSPGGVLVTGNKTLINTHDVIVRHMRFRVGTHNINFSRDANGDIIYYDARQYSFPPTNGVCQGNPTTPENGWPCAVAGGADPETLDSLAIIGQYYGNNDAYNIIIDHTSFGWGVDETLSITGGVTDTTVQWSIVSEGLSKAGHPKGEHSKGLLVSGKYVYPNTVSLHHNYIAHNRDRSPLILSPDAGNGGYVDTLVDFSNNVIYNWYHGLSPHGKGSSKINWIHNYAEPGQDSFAYFELSHTAWYTTPNPQLYVYGNIGASRLDQNDPHWNIGESWTSTPLSTDWQRNTPWSAPAVITTEMSYEYALEILQDVGATMPFRDSVDTRVVADFDAGTGAIRDNVVFPDDFPTFPNPAPPADTDDDGMADAWEISVFGDLTRTDSGDDDSDGYTNIEEYLHYLSGGAPPNSPPVLDAIADITVNEGEDVTFAPTASDSDGDALSFTYSGWMTSDTYTTTYDDAGTHTVTVTVSDGELTDSQDVTVTVNNVNRAPVLGPVADITVTEGDTVRFAPTAADPDGDTLAFSYSGWMTSASYSTIVGDEGVHTVTVTVSDARGGTDAQEVTVTVNAASPPLLSEADGGGGCFLATAAYGTPVSEEVKGLRAFRDDHLLPNGFGRSVIDVYYRCGPEAARLVARREGLRAMVRFCLTPVLTGGREGM